MFTGIILMPLIVEVRCFKYWSKI